MPLQTEYEFTLPKGYIDENGGIHRKGVMRLATAADEIIPLKDPRVQQNPGYLSIILLSRVIVLLEGCPEITPSLIERLFTADLSFLQNMYNVINDSENPTMTLQCPDCGKIFTQPIRFSAD